MDTVKTLEKKRCVFIKKRRHGQPAILIPKNPVKNQKLGRLLCDYMIGRKEKKKKQMREIAFQIPAELFDEWKDRATQDSAFGHALTEKIIDLTENGFDIIEKRKGEL